MMLKNPQYLDIICLMDTGNKSKNIREFRAARDLLQKQVYEVAEALDIGCSIIEGAEGFLETKAEKIQYVLDEKEGTTFFNILFTTNDMPRSVFTATYSSKYSEPPLAKVESARFPNTIDKYCEIYTYLSKKSTDMIRQAIFSKYSKNDKEDENEYEEKRKAEQESLKREAEELSLLVESACKTTKGAEEFLENYAEIVFRKLDIEKGTVLFVIVIKQDNPLDNIKTIFFNPKSTYPIYNAEVTINNGRNEHSKYLSKKSTDMIREAIFSKYYNK